LPTLPAANLTFKDAPKVVMEPGPEQMQLTKGTKGGNLKPQNAKTAHQQPLL
jgi:hypothetical protein